MGDCLSIHLGESARERAEEEKIRFQPPSSRQSAPILSVPQTLERETGPETDRTPNKYV